MINSRVKEKNSGMMGRGIKESIKMGRKMVKVNFIFLMKNQNI